MSELLAHEWWRHYGRIMPPEPPGTGPHPQQLPTRYWHGTKASLHRGDRLLPRREHGGVPTSGPLVPGGQRLPQSDDWVYITTDRNLAWAYAHCSGGTGNPVVLLVEPVGAIEQDPEHSDYMPVYRCEAATVLVVDPRPAMTSEQAWQGWRPVVGSRSVEVKNAHSPE